MCIRDSIYSDLQALREAGTDIVLRKVGGRCEYFIAGRTFELAELKLLVDAVACSRFITPKKSRELIGKLESLTSVYQASQLNRQIFVADRIKADNEEIYYTVDLSLIHIYLTSFPFPVRSAHRRIIHSRFFFGGF